MAKLPPFEGMLEFVAAVDAESLSAAAESLGVSVAHVSRKVSALERDLGQQLLLRTPRGCVPTDAGRSFHAQGKVLLAGLEEARDAVRSGGATASGLIRISIGGYFAERQILPLLTRFAAAHPAIELDIGVVTRNVDLVAEGYDLVIRAGPLADSRMRASKIAVFQGHTLAAPAYLASHGTPAHPQELDPSQCLVLGHREWVFMRGGTRVAFAPAGRVRGDSGLTMLAATRAGLGIAQVPSYYGKEDLAQGTLVRLFDGWQSAGVFEFFAVLPPASYTPGRVRQLVDFLHAELSL
ncbi:LysR family transcriptional regulator [Luteibacter sp. ME-Dv--P-043b]|uniref:LysR family transcriptional regulator n=1 Tax=Luteibacter sp. ME-Dv--P-043b TaxID=3040291 RepID=UPI002554352D|nr:LysR family transcriptional regulator [Luteibacter sp. ME-Dv--P-043b]